MPIDRTTGARLVAIVCTAQVFVQIGAFYWPALMPQMMRHWSLSNSEAGWITSSFYAAYMLSVPVLVTLTDRIDAKRVYLFGVGSTLVAHSGLRPAGRRLLVGDGAARARRHRLGRHLHDRPETAGRPGRRQDDVARRHRPRRQHRHLGRASPTCWAIFWPSEFGWRWAFASAGLTGGDRLGHRCARRARPAAAGAQARRPAGAVRLPPGAAQPLGLRLLAGLLRAHAGNERAARLGRGLPGLGRGPAAA